MSIERIGKQERNKWRVEKNRKGKRKLKAVNSRKSENRPVPQGLELHQAWSSKQMLIE